MRQLFHDGGWTFVTILGFSMLGWTIVGWKWLQLRAERGDGLRWSDRVIALLRRRARNEARAICEAQRGLAARVLHEAVCTAEPQRRFFEVRIAPLLHAEATRLRDHLPLLAVIAGLCPLLGLLGTVLGMMTTFAGITTGGAIEPDVMARGISQALVTTQAGLVMALPLLLMHGVLRARADRLLDAVGLRVKQVETIVCRD